MGNIGVTAYCNLLAAGIVERINEVFDNDSNTGIICFYDLGDIFLSSCLSVLLFVGGIIS